MEILKSVDISLPLKVWYKSVKNPSGIGLFFLGRLFAASISFHV
jgi:hypothetical protein